MEFNDVLTAYAMQLATIKRFSQIGAYSEDYLLGRRVANFYWLQDMINFTGRDYVERTNVSDEELKQYEFDGDWPYKLIEYRGEVIPVFYDDYGQQDYVVIRGEVCSGGSYNLNALDEFMYEMDIVLEREYLDGAREEV